MLRGEPQPVAPTHTGPATGHPIHVTPMEATGLHPTPYDQIANWAFVDWMLNFGEETIQSTIKIRQAGFADCIDTHESFRRQLTRLRDLRIIP